MVKKLISICIPTYNGEQFIAEAMDSAISQTYGDLEIVVSDDASSDKTLNIVENYKGKTTIPIHIFNHNPNGIGANWNNCIKKAQGEYIKFLFQDDILEPTCIEEMVAVMEKDKNIGLVASKRKFKVEKSYNKQVAEKWMNWHGDLQRKLKLPQKNNYKILTKKTIKQSYFFKSPLNKVGEPSVVLFRKNLVNTVGYFNEDFKQILDYEFYYKLLKFNYSIAVLDKELVTFRLHGDQATNINKATGFSDYELYDKILYKDFFWLMNMRDKIRFFKKYNPKLSVLLNSISQLKQKLLKVIK